MYRVVLDTNVLVSAIRSRQGASYRLISLIGDPRWELTISVALVLEYEAVARRQCVSVAVPESAAVDIIDMICAVGRQTPVKFLLRPALRDPEDDFILELAVAGQCEFIITHNLRDFAGSERFGVRAVTPREFLAIMEKEP